MTRNQGQKRENITLQSLEVELRSLREVEVPETLKAKLLAGIAGGKAKVAQEHQVHWRPGVWGVGIAAVTVLILVLIFVPNYGPSVPSQTLVADLNDRATRHALGDQNNTLLEDTNYANRSGQR